MVAKQWRWMVGVLVALAVPATAEAAPTWLSPVRVGPPSAGACAVDIGGYQCDADVGMDAAGNAYLAAVVNLGSSRRVGVMTRPAGGGFSTMTMLEPAISVRGFDIAQVMDRQMDLAVDSRGGVTVVWSVMHNNQGTPSQLDDLTSVYAAYKPPGASAFGASQVLSDTAEGAEKPSVAVSDDGGAVVVWRNRSGANHVVRATFRPPGGTTFGGASTISGAAANNTLDMPKVAMAPNGNAIAVWIQNRTIRAAARPAGGAFAGSVPLSGALATPPTISSFDTTVAEPDVAIAPGGQATAVWQYDQSNTSTDTDDIVQSAERTIVPNFAGGTWGAAARVTELGETAVNPVVAVDATGLATAVWYGTIAGESKIRAATRPNGGGWADHRPGSGPGMDTNLSPTPQIDLSPQGDAVVMWARYDGTNHLLEAATKPRGGAFGPVRVVKQGFTSGGQEHRVSFRPLPGVGFDNEGNGVATWIAYDYPAEDYYIESAGFDASAPRFNAVSVPTSGGRGAVLRMAATISDRWTASQVTWSFGDGGTANGTNVSHAYAAAGVYTLRVTATDAVGNAATVTRAVQITAPAGIDADGDGFFRGTNPGQDCDDGNARINPGATDVARQPRGRELRRPPGAVPAGRRDTQDDLVGARLATDAGRAAHPRLGKGHQGRAAVRRQGLQVQEGAGAGEAEARRRQRPEVTHGWPADS